MTVEEFRAASAPGADWSAALTALWLDQAAGWDAAHDALQDDATDDGAWVHAYLHRKEGDPGNAGYWYRRANRPVAAGSLADEWAAITASLLTSR